MRILVTGGAGYIGSITTRHLLDSGHDCVVLDTLERGWEVAIDPRARLIVGSVGDRGLLERAISWCDAVMHLAGYIEVAESQENPERYFENNSHTPLVMLDVMRECGVDILVFSSTAAVYGEPQTLPIEEDAPTVPLNAYGESKLRFEAALEEGSRNWGLRSVRFRYFNVAGAWLDGSMGEAHDPETHLVPRILGAMRAGQTSIEIYGGDYDTPDGTCVRDYIHVLDLATAHRLALEYLYRGGCSEVLNLGNGVGFSNRELVDACAGVTGVPVNITVGPRRAGDPARLVASPVRASKVLGWSPEHSSIHGIVESAWRWHLAHPNGYR